MRVQWIGSLLGSMLLFTIVTLIVFLAPSNQSTAQNTNTVTGVYDADIDRILALSDDVAYGEYLASECASCHSVAPVPGSTVPVLYGLPPFYIVRAILEYRDGVRPNTTMGAVASALGDEEIAVIAHYLSEKK